MLNTRMRKAIIVEPIVTCPYCKKEIKLTESLAAPMVEVTKREHQGKLADNESEVAKRECAIGDQQQALKAA